MPPRKMPPRVPEKPLTLTEPQRITATIQTSDPGDEVAVEYDQPLPAWEPEAPTEAVIDTTPRFGSEMVWVKTDGSMGALDMLTGKEVASLAPPEEPTMHWRVDVEEDDGNRVVVSAAKTTLLFRGQMHRVVGVTPRGHGVKILLERLP